MHCASVYPNSVEADYGRKQEDGPATDWASVQVSQRFEATYRRPALRDALAKYVIEHGHRDPANIWITTKSPELTKTGMNAPAGVPTTLEPFGIPVPRPLPQKMLINFAIYNAAWQVEEASGDNDKDADYLSELRRGAFDGLMSSPADTAEIAAFKLRATTMRYADSPLSPEQLQPIFDDLDRISARPRAAIDINLSNAFQISLSAFNRADAEHHAYSNNVHDPLCDLRDVAKREFEAGRFTEAQLEGARLARRESQLCADALAEIKNKLLDALVDVQANTLDELHDKLRVMDAAETGGRYEYEFSKNVFGQLLNDISAIGDPS